jgi:hypothetical protein
MPTTLTPTLSIKTLPEWEQNRLRSGMRAPRVVRLFKGEKVYRFASSFDRYKGVAIPPAQWATGPWWFREQDFRKIEDAEAHSLKVHGGDRNKALTLGFLARWAGAVKQEWSNVDRLVSAELLADLEVFAGAGRTQHGERPPTGVVKYNLRITWQGWNDVEQLYVPNLDRNNPGHLVDGRHVLQLAKPVAIASQQLWI